MEDSGNAKKGAERYLTFLAEEGYRPWITADVLVTFKCEGRIYVIDYDDKDAEYFGLINPIIYPIESEEELARVKEAALAVTAKYKVVKIYPAGDTTTMATVMATVQLFCSPPEAFEVVFNRCLHALRNGVEQFIALMQEPPKPPDDFVFHLPTYNVGEN